MYFVRAIHVPHLPFFSREGAEKWMGGFVCRCGMTSEFMFWPFERVSMPAIKSLNTNILQLWRGKTYANTLHRPEPIC
jgi:hypothetical protein